MKKKTPPVKIVPPEIIRWKQSPHKPFSLVDFLLGIFSGIVLSILVYAIFS